MNQADMTVGIPALVNCLVMVPFSIFFHYAYDVGPYIIDRHGRPRSSRSPSSRAEAGAAAAAEAQYLRYQGGPLGVRAFTGMLNPSEFLGAIAFAFTMFRHRRGGAGAGKNGGSGSAAGGAYDDGDVSSGNRDGPPGGYEAGYDGHEMSRREQRRAEKAGRGHHGRRYEHRGGGGGGGYDNRGYR